MRVERMVYTLVTALWKGKAKRSARFCWTMTAKWFKKQDCLELMFVAGHQLLWILAKSWRSANIWQVFKIGGRIYFTLLGFFLFFLCWNRQNKLWVTKPKYIICKTPHYVSSSICLYPEISFECWDHLFARIELFLNENRYLRCHAERPVSGWVWSYFIWREWFSLSYEHRNKASWTHSWRATFNQSAFRAFVLVIIW